MTFQAMLWKDASRELRSRQGLQAGLILVALFFVLYLFIFADLRGEFRAATAVIWTPVLYATAAIAGRGIAVEADRGTLEMLRGGPSPLINIGLSRTLVDGFVAALLGGLSLALARLIFGVPAPPALWLVMGLGVVGLTLLGSFTGAITAQAQARELLLPLLLVPVAAPLLLAGVGATLEVLAGGFPRAALLVMAGYDLALAGVVWLLWPIVLEAD